MVIRPVHEPCMKSVRTRIYSGPYFPAFELNTDRYSVSLRIQLKCGKIPTRITPNTDIFYAVEKFVVNDKDTRIDQVSLVLNKVRRPSKWSHCFHLAVPLFTINRKIDLRCWRNFLGFFTTVLHPSCSNVSTSQMMLILMVVIKK